MAERAPRHLLDGYKVLDFTHFIAGPTATRLMAGMGADVVKVERAPKGDQARAIHSIRGTVREYKSMLYSLGYGEAFLDVQPVISRVI